MKAGRIDVNMGNRIAEIVSDGKPTLVCVNQMTRLLDWYKNAEEANRVREMIQSGIIPTAKNSRGAVTVWFTDFAPENMAFPGWDVDMVIDAMRQRDYKSAEDVRSSYQAMLC